MDAKNNILRRKGRPHTGLWLLVVAAIALESIACLQYFYSRSVIRDEAVYRARAELRAAELEINVATAELEAAAKMLAKMAEYNLQKPNTMPMVTGTMMEMLEGLEGVGIAFIPDYYPEQGRWYEVYSRRVVDGEKTSIQTQQIGGVNHDYLQLEWFNNGLRIDSTWWSEPYLDNAGAKDMVVTCSYPVHDKQGKKVAVVCVDMSLSRLQRVSEYLQVYKDSYYSIRSSAGIDLVARPDTTPGRKYMIFDEEIDSTGWHLSVIIPEDILFAELNRVGLWVSLMMLLSLALLIFIMYRSAQNIMSLIAVNNVNERMEGELEIAKTIQTAMLPKVFPPFSDRPDLNIYGMVQPAKEIGGDLYDFYVRHDKLFFCVGDVSGKGVPASLVMATIRSLFRSTTAHTEAPDKIAQEINNTIAEQNEQNMFVTLFIGVLDLSNGMLSYCNAGHNAPVHMTFACKPRMIDVQANLPLGVVYGYEYVCQQIQMHPGEMLFLYTDGLTEAEDVEKNQFGESRMMDILACSYKQRPREIVDAMKQQVVDFVGAAPQSDDLTMLAIRYQVPAIVMRNDIQQIPTLAEWVDGLHVPDELNMPINLALEETVSNVMLYAYPGRDDGKVFVEYMEAEDEEGKSLIFTITDSGVPFDPTKKDEADINLSAEERPIGGLGIHLVRQLMDEIRYEREDGKNLLTLIKKI